MWTIQSSLTSAILIFVLAAVAIQNCMVEARVALEETENDNDINNGDTISSFIDYRNYNNDANDSECGGLLETTGIDTLAYKFQKPLIQYESCLWTLSVHNHTTIKINVTDTYYRVANNNNEYISVGFFNKSNYDQLSFLTWIKLPYSIDAVVLEVPGPVVFIHFVAVDPHPGLGFRLTYEAGAEEQTSIYGFHNYYLTGEFGTFTYPQNGGKYLNNQRVTIVLKPNSGLPITGNPTPSATYVKNRGVEESLNCTVDNINVYGLGSTSAAWTKYATICGSTGSLLGPYLSYYPRNDPIIITFKSDDSGVGAGFELYWRNF